MLFISKIPLSCQYHPLQGRAGCWDLSLQNWKGMGMLCGPHPFFSLQLPGEGKKSQTAVQEVPKTTLKFHDSLEGLTELRKVTILTIMTYYSKRKSCVGQSPRATRCDFPSVLSQWSHGTVLTSPSSDVWQRAQVIATGEAHPGLGTQGFCGGSVMSAWLTTYMTDFSLQPLEVKLIPYGPRPPS